MTRPWGKWTLSDAPIGIASTASTQASVVINRRGNSETAFLPAFTLRAESNNFRHRLGVFADAATATRAFDVLEAAAMRLHALYGTTPDETITVP